MHAIFCKNFCRIALRLTIKKMQAGNFSDNCKSGEIMSSVNCINYISFPAKLFRIVSNDKYSTIWWSSCGSHFVVDVPRFESEFLQNNTIPTIDKFKTLAFTSLIRQLNLYGFRKVAVNNERHTDPRGWQRYAHPFFLRGRLDYLQRIKRQLSLRNLNHSHYNHSIIIDAMRGYQRAVKENFLGKGIRPSRKGPKPKKHSKGQRKRNPSHIGNCKLQCNLLTFNIGSNQVLQAFVLPHLKLSTECIPCTSLGSPVNSHPWLIQTPLQSTLPVQQGINNLKNCSKIFEVVSAINQQNLPIMYKSQCDDMRLSCGLSKTNVDQADVYLLNQPHGVQSSNYLENSSKLIDQHLEMEKIKNTEELSDQLCPDISLSQAFVQPCGPETLEKFVDKTSSEALGSSRCNATEDLEPMKFWIEEAAFNSNGSFMSDHIFCQTTTSLFN